MRDPLQGGTIAAEADVSDIAGEGCFRPIAEVAGLKMRTLRRKVNERVTLLFAPLSHAEAGGLTRCNYRTG